MVKSIKNQLPETDAHLGPCSLVVGAVGAWFSHLNRPTVRSCGLAQDEGEGHVRERSVVELHRARRLTA